MKNSNRHPAKLLERVTFGKTTRQCAALVGLTMLYGAVIAHGEESVPADNSIARSESEFGSFSPITLAGDTKATQITTNWELDLCNSDGDQNQMSMVKCGDWLYVGITFQQPLTRVLVIRRYNALTGEHTAADDFALTELPISSQNSYFTLASDDNDNLLVGYVGFDGSNYVLSICKINTDTMQLDSSTMYTFQIPVPNPYTSCRPVFESINDFSGSVTSGTFSFDALCAFASNGANYTHRYYRFTSVDGSTSVSSLFIIPTSCIAIKDNDYRLDVASVPSIESTFVISQGYDKNSDTHYAPQILSNALSDSEVSEGYITADWDDTHNGVENCRGFHTFLHNGHLMGVFPSHAEGKGFAFQLISWPNAEDGDLSTITPVCKMPAVNSFVSASSEAPIYQPFYRHIALTETPSTATFAATSAASTNLYVCSPGRGLASYTIYTPGATTGSVELCSDAEGQPSITFDGATVRVENAASSAHALPLLSICDIAGRLQLVQPITSDCVSVSVASLSPGVYIAAASGTVLRFAIR